MTRKNDAGQQRAKEAAAPKVSPKHGSPPGPEEQAADLRAGLEEAAGDLLFLSETESRFEYVELPGTAPAELTPQTVVAALGEPDAPVQTRSLDDWLGGHIERADPADPVMQEAVPRYRALKAALTASLADVQVFRIGEVQLRYYALGRTADGRIAGLMATALET